MKHGKGVVERPNGDRYEGDWFEDKIHGIGKFTRQNGDYYHGEWNMNRINGKGVCV